jgi:3',5'-cyclic AMP phosphodiesterase CpdA
MKLLHISDLHFRTDIDTRAWSIFFEQIGLRFPDHTLVLTGDVVDDGQEAEFDMAEGFLAPFKGRLLMCSGNHDYGLAGNIYLQECVDHYNDFDSKVLPIPHDLGSVLIGDVQFVRITSSFQTLKPFEFACGEVGPDQMEWMKTVLSSSLANRKVVYLHHHPFIHADPTMKLLDADEFMQACRDGNVDILLFGHKHVARMWKGRAGIPLVCAGGRTTQDGSAWEIDTDTLEVRAVNLS